MRPKARQAALQRPAPSPGRCELGPPRGREQEGGGKGEEEGVDEAKGPTGSFESSCAKIWGTWTRAAFAIVIARPLPCAPHLHKRTQQRASRHIHMLPLQALSVHGARFPQGPVRRSVDEVWEQH